MDKTRKAIRLGIVGIGGMGTGHLRNSLVSEGVTLVALADTDPARLEKARESIPPGYGDVTFHGTAQALLEEAKPDAILVSTPHYDHEPIAIAAFRLGIHVLVEKPVTVTVAGAKRMLDAWKQARLEYPNLQYGVMFMQRTYGYWKKIKQLIDEGELGRIQRATWIVTDWFRTQQYYNNGGWRATWKGEGGGVLTNQSPHNLDLLQWFLGMPDRITAFGALGKYHTINVEDEICAILEYDTGCQAQFITSTAEAPGTNRLEIMAENGRLCYENGVLQFRRNRQSARVFSDTANTGFDTPECWDITLPFKHHGEGGHKQVLENFARGILNGEKLVCGGEEGINQVVLTNAMMVSLLEGRRTVSLPLDDNLFPTLLADLQSKEKTWK